MKKVLIALDYGPSAQKVAEAGYRMSRAMHASTILLHVLADATYYTSLNYSPIMGIGFGDPVETDSVAELRKLSQNYLAAISKHLGDEMIKSVVKSGNVGATILDTAVCSDVDVIVIGTHGRRGLKKFLMGSVAETVLRHSQIPMFIVPTKPYDDDQYVGNT